MRVLRVKVHNILKVSDIDLNLEGHHLFLVGGKNEQGKSSALKALLMALCGRSGMDWPGVSLKEGEDEGWVKVDLVSDTLDMEVPGAKKSICVELFLRRKRGGQVVEQFRITDGDGTEATKPRELLQRLYQLKAFDPLAFEHLDRKEKKAVLMKLIGLDFSGEKAEYDRLYDERTAVNRDGKRQRARFDSMPSHPGAPAKEVLVTELLAEMDRRHCVNDTNEEEREKLDQLGADCTSGLEEADDIVARVRVLNESLASLLAENGRLMAAKLAQSEVVENLKDEDVEEVGKQIADAETINRNVRENAAKVEVSKDLEAMRKKSAELSDALDQITAKQQSALKAAKFPVAGLSFDDEGVLYQGLPFEQSARSVQLLTSVRIGMALNPQLRLLVCEDGSDLDVEHLETLQKVLEEEDFQCLVEIVTRSSEDEDRCAVILENGKSKRVSS